MGHAKRLAHELDGDPDRLSEGAADGRPSHRFVVETQLGQDLVRVLTQVGSRASRSRRLAPELDRGYDDPKRRLVRGVDLGQKAVGVNLGMAMYLER